MTTQANGKYLCDCGKFILLKKDGTFRSHTSNTKAFPGAPYNEHCKGSGTKP